MEVELSFLETGPVPVPSVLLNVANTHAMNLSSNTHTRFITIHMVGTVLQTGVLVVTQERNMRSKFR